jgi:hypothetical protein
VGLIMIRGVDAEIDAGLHESLWPEGVSRPMRLKRIHRPWPWLLGAAILSGPMLVGCSGNQTSGTPENIPKESPVLQSKDSMDAFLKGRKAQQGKRP